MESRVYLRESYFADGEQTVLTTRNLLASTFTYSTGVCGVRLRNERGAVVLLPYMGQMIWRCEFDGRELAMRSIYTEPERDARVFGETYGCFLMHCGLTAMGNPTPKDTHAPHGELPVARYQTVFLVSGEDEKGRYIGLGGTYSHKRCYETNYDFSPLVKLYEGKTSIDVTVSFRNNKDVPLEYYYLCHINHRAVDGSRLLYTAPRDSITVYHEVPDDYFSAEIASKTNRYLKKLDNNSGIMDHVGAPGQSYAPEIVFCCAYESDSEGRAYTMQQYPDGDAVYVIHRPSELPYGVRWISRTEDENAMGMVLPATAEHKGRLYCQSKGQGKYLSQGETVTYHIETGLLDSSSAKEMAERIRAMGF
ncbi:MAG: DUF4432 family protein [Clostridia bacterium]|nr:DUF4432 family protein [Clostridia bacterium]